MKVKSEAKPENEPCRYILSPKIEQKQHIRENFIRIAQIKCSYNKYERASTFIAICAMKEGRYALLRQYQRSFQIVNAMQLNAI